MAHVPRFGNWDADNVPYSAYFDNARRQTSITRSKDSEVFSSKNNDDVDASRASSRSRSRSHRRHREGRSNGRRHQLHHLKSMTTQEDSEIRKFDDSVMDKLNLGKYQGGNDNNYNNNMAATFSPPSRQIKLRDSAISHSSQQVNKEGTLVPEFGGWDVTDAKSAQGYTAIFRKIRQEKISAKRRPHYLPNNNTQPLNNNIQNQCNTSSSKFSKVMTQCCCCLFPHATK
ncbi:hypothetical protein PIB30_036031 [Stylosanthes scabra]|uniref:RIN4 pathogenic type III effector avirulence factor Avr cleavage site domain-containing protein n=1 Tax=Stylosanthes scabra TaxID=79078 RepID=A0ABU6XEW5_9FABA|nr:hypothetical protein [Stylosanthes scabra]